MNWRYMIGLSALTALGFALLPSSAISQQKSLKEQLIGTWTLVSATHTTNIEASSSPNLDGGTQKRIITSLSADELKYTNPASQIGSVDDVVWKRAK
jgi:hypothetical protein